MPQLSMPRLSAVTDGDLVADFAESFLHVSKGKLAGGPLVLTEWQRHLLDGLFERRADGRLRFQRSLIGLPRKNGKSLLGSAIALYQLIEGEAGAEVYAAAGDRQQARVVFNEAKWQVVNSPALSGICKVYRDYIEVPSTGAIFRVLSSDAKLQQGLNPSCVIFDELHVQPNDDLWDALTLGSGARKDPQVVAITTAGYDLESLCGRLYLYGKKIMGGEVDDDSFGFWWWEAPADCDLWDRQAWYESNPNLQLGLLDETDFETSIKQTSETSVRRYKLNQWTRSQESWLPAGAWEACTDHTVAMQPGADTWVGVDMALKHDSIAIVTVQKQGEQFVTGCRIWHPESAGVDVQEVEQYLRELHQRFRLVEVAFDPAYFQRSAEILHDDGIPMVEFPQSANRMVPACGQAYELIVGGKVRHDGSPTFTDQVLSAAQRMTDNGWRLSKGKSRRKIDAAIALVMALDRASRRPPEEIVPMFFNV